MKRAMCVIAAIFLFSSFIAGCEQYSDKSEEKAKTIVDSMTSETDLEAEFIRLNSIGLPALKVLVKELKVIPEKKIWEREKKDHKESLKVINCIRALYYLTCIKYAAPTKYKFDQKDSSDDEFYQLDKLRNYWLHYESKKEVFFYGYWPSRGTIFIAPEDAQKDIIRKWNEWLENEGKTFDLRKVIHPNINFDTFSKNEGQPLIKK